MVSSVYKEVWRKTATRDVPRQERIDGFVRSEACSRLADLKPSQDHAEPSWREQAMSFKQLDEPVSSIRKNPVCGIDFRKTSNVKSDFTYNVRNDLESASIEAVWTFYYQRASPF